MKEDLWKDDGEDVVDEDWEELEEDWVEDGEAEDWEEDGDEEEIEGSPEVDRKSHEILIETEVDCPEDLPALIRSTITYALKEEKVELPCEINVLLTDNKGIQEINLESRGLDKATDVLSFPMFEFQPACPPTSLDSDLVEPCSGLLPLGDMALSLEKVSEQALEYGHDFSTEVTYLLLHSVLHLLGYDHEDEGVMKKQMRTREKEILEMMGIDPH